MINVSAFALRDCDFVGNYFMNRTGGAYGGALHVLNSSGVVSNTFFRSNTVIGSYSVGYGGAINVTGGSVALRDITLIANNSYGQWASETRWYGCGGGISFNGGSHSLSNAVLFLNETQRHIQLTATEGGGIYVFNNASVAISHATIAGHSSDGLYVAAGNVTLRNSILANNYPDIGGGGAIGAKQAALTLSNSTFAGNTSNNNSSGGGAILTHSTVGTISDCVFSNNVVNAQTGPAGHNRAVSGGALHLGRSSFAIRDCLFIGNKAIAHKDKSSAGGALFYCDGRVSIRNSIFASNHITNNSNVVTLMGAAVYQHNVSFLSSARKLSLENCTIVGNTSDGITGNGVYGNNNYMELVNTILLSNQPHDFTNLTAVAFSHCRADRLISGERGNITADPLLINPAGGNFGLRTMGGQYTPGGRVVRYDANSPCIDGGTNLNWMAAVTDLRGFARLAHGLPTSGGKPRVDMGAIEVHIPRSGTTMIVQ